MKISAFFLGALLVTGPAAAAGLPATLELEYLFSYESIEVGRATKQLRRTENGNYVYSLWMRPTGMARAFTSVEFAEEGAFRVDSKSILPQWFVDIRRGDRKAYERKVTFDWAKSALSFSDGRELPLATGTQDQASLVYLFMLNPLTKGERSILVTDGKDVEPFRFVYAGREILRTPLGTLDTIVIKRLSQKQIEQERRCRAEGKYPAGCPINDFTIWLAPSKQYVAVKLQKRRKQETLTLVLESVRGL